MAVLRREKDGAAVSPSGAAGETGAGDGVEAGAAAAEPAPAATPVAANERRAARAPVARSCAACSFWWKQSVSPDEARPKEAACHRDPPMAGGLWAQWPQTRPVDWCGCFEAR